MRAIGRYELLTQLASGNTGYVFSACLADDPARSAAWTRRSHGPDDATHALKLIKPKLSRDARYSQSLRVEAPAAITFRHKNAARIVEIAQVGTDIFIAMELVRGQTLASVLDRAAADRRLLPRDLVLWIGKRVAGVLAAAHQTPWHAGDESGMLHGEVSPHSVLITYDGDVRLLGVGVGRSRLCLPPARSRLPYRAPELFEKKRVDATADVYGLGVVLYDALTGQQVFARDAVPETTQAVLDGGARPLVLLVPDVGTAVSDLVASMMGRTPSERPRSMAQVEHALSSELRQPDSIYEGGLAREMQILFAEEMLDLPWVEFTPGVLDAPAIASAAEETLRNEGPGAWRIAQPRPPSPPGARNGRTPPPASWPQAGWSSNAFGAGAVLDSFTDAPFQRPVRGTNIPSQPTPHPGSFALTPTPMPWTRPALTAPPAPEPAPAPVPPAPSDPRAIDDLDVDVLVAAIVAASSRPGSKSDPAIGKPTPPPTPANGRSESSWAPKTPPPPAITEVSNVPSSFSRALDEANSENDVDALVEAIVSASSHSRPTPAAIAPASPVTPPPVLIPSGHTPPPVSPRPPRTGEDKPFVLKEAFQPGAIVDVSSDPRLKRRSPLTRAFEDTTPERAVHHRMVVEAEKPEPQEALPRSPDPSAPTNESEIAMLEPGEVIGGRYRVVEKLGSGGMAVVYKVEHTLLEKAMALKLLRPELSMIPYVVQRFQREARFVSQLDDPRIVRVIDFGRADNGSLFLVMELIEGEPLSQRMADRGEMELDEVMRIMEQVLMGLEHAHRNNVIHRDLKPDNIMLIERGDMLVKIVDFGIAKLATSDAGGQTPAAALTQAGMVFGSPRYMSPEQASGDVVDARTDIYAAGVILYELLTGRRPFDGKSARAILSAALTQPPPPMNLTRPNRQVGKAIEEVVFTALAKEKEQRYPSAGALLDALRAAMSV